MDVPIINSTITYLEMTQNPNIERSQMAKYRLEKKDKVSVKSYMDLYVEIGRNYLWNYRPGQTNKEIKSVIQSTNTHIYYLYKDQTPIGLAEIDISNSKNLEVVHFGIIPDYANKGIGKDFFLSILSILWDTNPDRIWLSTCGMDHPKAIKFYENAGFSVFKITEGKFKDYRYNGFYKMTDAPQIPLAKEITS